MIDKLIIYTYNSHIEYPVNSKNKPTKSDIKFEFSFFLFLYNSCKRLQSKKGMEIMCQNIPQTFPQKTNKSEKH
ncbi:MAG TPA: hypothetical protein DIW17_17055 [Clostridiales bacterium]|jgi:hypothetical protein|nr:hypothetical protein [Clostridiales bacterium]